LFAECASPSATLGKAFAGCFWGFAECTWHSAKLLIPVVASIEAVSKVLPKSNTFLRNVGIQQPFAKTTNAMKEIQAKLDAKALESVVLQEELERVKAQTQESNAKVEKTS